MSVTEKEYEFSKGKVVYCISVDTHIDPNLVKTERGNTLSISMIRNLMKKGVIFKSLGESGPDNIMKPAGMNSVTGLDKLPEFDI